MIDSLLHFILNIEEFNYLKNLLENSHFLLLPIRFYITDESQLTNCSYFFQLYDLNNGNLVMEKQDFVRIRRDQFKYNYKIAKQFVSEMAVHLMRNKYDKLFK